MMDRRLFLKVSMAASGALLVGCGRVSPPENAAVDPGTWVANLYVCLLYTSDAADDLLQV